MTIFKYKIVWLVKYVGPNFFLTVGTYEVGF